MVKRSVALMIFLLLLCCMAGCVPLSDTETETTIVESEIETETFETSSASGTLVRTAVPLEDENLRLEILSCSDDANPIVQYMLEENWKKWGQSGGRMSAVYMNDETEKECIISYRDTLYLRNTYLTVNTYYKWDTLYVEFTRVEADEVHEPSDEIIVACVSDWTLKFVEYSVDGEVIDRIENWTGEIG